MLYPGILNKAVLLFCSSMLVLNLGCGKETPFESRKDDAVSQSGKADIPGWMNQQDHELQCGMKLLGDFTRSDNAHGYLMRVREEAVNRSVTIEFVADYSPDDGAAVAVWDLATGERLARQRNPRDNLASLTFTPKKAGKYLVGVYSISIYAAGEYTLQASCSPGTVDYGTCAGQCGVPVVGNCSCIPYCEQQGNCCSDFKPLCVSDGYATQPNHPRSALWFKPDGGGPSWAGEDWTGSQVMYSYRRLTDKHPECVLKTPNGKSVVYVVMRYYMEDGPAQENLFVAGFSSDPNLNVPIKDKVSFTARGKNMYFHFRCGKPPYYDTAFDDNNGKGYDVYIIR